MNPDNCKTIADLKLLRQSETHHLLHFVIGEGGRCMCGNYADENGVDVPMNCAHIQQLMTQRPPDPSL